MSLSKTDKWILQATGFISVKNKMALEGNYILTRGEKKGLYLILLGFLPLIPMIALSAVFNIQNYPGIHELINQVSMPLGLLALIGMVMHNTTLFAKKNYQAQRLNIMQIAKNNEIKTQKNELSLTLDDLQQNYHELNYKNEQEKQR